MLYYVVQALFYCKGKTKLFQFHFWLFPLYDWVVKHHFSSSLQTGVKKWRKFSSYVRNGCWKVILEKNFHSFMRKYVNILSSVWGRYSSYILLLAPDPFQIVLYSQYNKAVVLYCKITRKIPVVFSQKTFSLKIIYPVRSTWVCTAVYVCH